MKTRKLTLLSLTLLAVILLGAVVVSVVSPPPLKLKVKWTPRVYTLDTNPPDPWNAEMYFAPARPLEDIDVESILLEGDYGPDPEYEPYISASSRLVVPFDGYDVLAALSDNLPHMSPGFETRVSLEITGNLIDGTPFSGSGGINVVIPEPSPP